MLQVKDLSITTIAGEVILQPLSFELVAGGALTIVGETGSGKTLLAQAIANNLPADLIANGEIYLHGKAIHNLNEEARSALWGSTMCVLPQEPMRSLDPTMRALKQVSEGYHLSNNLSPQKAKEQAHADFAELQLSHATHQYPFELSGGMAQRVAFLAARSGGATFTIADEPTKGLDINRRDEITKQLVALIEANEGVLTITHDIEVAKQLGGRVMILREGSVIEMGQSEQVLDRPHHDYTKALINANPKHWHVRNREKQQNSPVLEVTKLSKSRGSRTLFDNLSLTLNPGGIIGVSGDSGCGKSTLGDILLGLLKSDSGSVNWKKSSNNKTIHTQHQAQKLFQDPSDVFSAHVTLRTSFKDVIKKYKIHSNKLEALLEELKLDSRLLDRYPDQVSGGELQRLAIVRVMLLEPSFIFADEPTSRLDMLTQQSVIQSLVNVVENNNVALMIVSHDKDLLDKTCDSVIHLS